MRPGTPYDRPSLTSGYSKDELKCGYNVVGAVRKEYSDPELIDVVLEVRKKPCEYKTCDQKKVTTAR